MMPRVPKHFTTEHSELHLDRPVWFKQFETWNPRQLKKIGDLHAPVIADISLKQSQQAKGDISYTFGS